MQMIRTPLSSSLSTMRVICPTDRASLDSSATISVSPLPSTCSNSSMRRCLVDLTVLRKTDLLDLTTPNRVICISAGRELIYICLRIGQRPIFLDLQHPLYIECSWIDSSFSVPRTRATDLSGCLQFDYFQANGCHRLTGILIAELKCKIIES